MLKNLLSNAFKLTEHGRVSLRIELAPRRMNFDNPVLNEAEQLIVFAVSDTGIGIPKDKHRFVFEAFQQADGTTSRRYGGTGLGLSISREIANLLGGAIEVVSAPGRGSTFSLILPLATERVSRLAAERDGAAEAALPATDIEAPPAIEARGAASSGTTREGPALPASDGAQSIRLGGKKGLVIDDDMRNVFALTSLLESHEMTVIYALDGKAGIDMLRTHRDVDVVLVDMMMPEMDGYETMRAIREDPRFGSLPLIAVTAKALKEDRARCLAAGASDYLPKPVDPETLLAMVDQWTRG